MIIVKCGHVGEDHQNNTDDMQPYVRFVMKIWDAGCDNEVRGGI